MNTGYLKSLPGILKIVEFVSTLGTGAEPGFFQGGVHGASPCKHDILRIFLKHV